jgi:hypothetical protein
MFKRSSVTKEQLEELIKVTEYDVLAFRTLTEESSFSN